MKFIEFFKAASTLCRENLKTQLYSHSWVFCPHYAGRFCHQKWSFSKTPVRVDKFENTGKNVLVHVDGNLF